MARIMYMKASIQQARYGGPDKDMHLIIERLRICISEPLPCLVIRVRLTMRRWRPWRLKEETTAGISASDHPVPRSVAVMHRFR